MKIINRMDAAKLGLSRFCTGKPCRRGHNAERFVSNGVCITCAALAKEEWRQKLLRTQRQARERTAEVR